MPNIREHSSRTRAHNSAKSMTVLPHRFAMHYTHREHNSDILYNIIKPVHSVQPLLLLLLLLLLCPVSVGAVLLPLVPSCRVTQDRRSRSSQTVETGSKLLYARIVSQNESIHTSQAQHTFDISFLRRSSFPSREVHSAAWKAPGSSIRARDVYLYVKIDPFFFCREGALLK